MRTQVILYKFLSVIKEELKGTANYNLFKYITKSYIFNKFGLDFSNFREENFQEAVQSARKYKQKIVLIIEDIDRIQNHELKHVIKFLWHIKELPYMITILPAQSQVLHSCIENLLPSNSQIYHKLIDHVYNLTREVRYKQLKWLWSVDNELYNKSDNEISIDARQDITVKDMLAYANPEYVNQDIFFIDSECIKFNGQSIMINDLPQKNREKVIELSSKITVNYKELLFLPLNMLNFWQNTTIFPNWRHEELFRTIILRILDRFHVTTTEIKKFIILFKDNYTNFKDKNIFDVLVYSLIEIRYKFLLQDEITIPSGGRTSTLTVIKNIVMKGDSFGIDLNYQSLSQEIKSMLEFTSSFSKIFTSISPAKNYSGLFDSYYLFAGLLHCNNHSATKNVSEKIVMNDAHRFNQSLFSRIDSIFPTISQHLLFMFYHYWLVLTNRENPPPRENIHVNTLYKLSSLKFFEETYNHNEEMTDAEIRHCFSSVDAIYFVILYIINYHELLSYPFNYLENYGIWMTKNIFKAFTLMQNPKQHPLFNIYMQLSYYFVIKNSIINGRNYSTQCLFLCIEGSYKLRYPDHAHHNIYIKLGNSSHYEDLRIPLQQFINNLNSITELG